MGTLNFTKTDLYNLHNYVQQTMISFPKELFIETLRAFFNDDSYYRYQADQYGFPKVPDHTNMPADAGLENNLTTRLFIGEPYRQDMIFYPSLLVRNGGSKSVPLSMSRDQDSLQWEDTVFIDGYGNQKIFQTPVYFVQAGAWEGSITVDVETKSPRARDELVELVSILFVDTRFNDMKNSGVVIKSGSPSAGSPSETDDRNGKLFKQTITFDIRSEWRRQIPVGNIISAINICMDLGNLAVNPPALAPNLEISTTIDLISALQSL